MVQFRPNYQLPKFSGLVLTTRNDDHKPVAEATLYPAGSKEVGRGEIKLNGKSVVLNDPTVAEASSCLFDGAMPWAASLREILLKGILRQVITQQPVFEINDFLNRDQRVTAPERWMLNDLAGFGRLEQNANTKDWTISLQQSPRWEV